MIVHKHNSKLIYHLYCMHHRVRETCSYLLKCRIGFALEWLQLQSNDPVSFLECIGVYSNPYFDLELAETLPPNRVAELAFAFGSWWWRCSGTWMMDWMSYMWCVDGVWTKKNNKRTSGFWSGQFWLKMTSNGGLKVVWCWRWSGSVWVDQTCLFWCLEHVGTIGFA